MGGNPRVYFGLGSKADGWPLIKLIHWWARRRRQGSVWFQKCPQLKGTSETLLLSQKLEHGWEVFLRVALCTHHPVDLMGLTAEDDRALCAGRRVLCQSQVLSHERCSKSTLIVISRRNSIHHPRYRIVSVTWPAPSWAHVQDFSQQPRVKP